MNELRQQLLIKKEYYKSLLESDDILKNIRFLSSQLKKNGNLSSEKVEEIRFVQAELYWLLEDYEVAIYKWNNVESPVLSGWAVKNIGDAYLELDMVEKAESSYLSVSSPSSILKMENLLSLFSLYRRNNQEDKAHLIVDELVTIDYTYKNVGGVALQFYEQINEYISAIKLVILQLELEYTEENLLRLYRYLDESQDNKISPSSSISKLLILLWEKDKNEFLSLLQTLTHYYIDSSYLLEWLDCLFSAGEQTDYHLIKFILEEQAIIFILSIDKLLSGKYSLEELKPIIEIQILKYYSICEESPLKSSLGALLKAWEEVDPNSINNAVLENISFTNKKIYEIDTINDYYSNLKKWMDTIKIDYDTHSNWWLDYWIADRNKKVMIAGSFSNGKSSFINSILQEEVLNADQLPTTSVVTIIRYGENRKLLELNDESIAQMSLDKLLSKTTINHNHSSILSNNLISLEVNAAPLLENSVILIDTPGFNDTNSHNNPTYEHLNLADELLFLFNAETPYKKTEKEALIKILEEQPDLPIRFILNKADYLDEDELEEIIEDIERKLIKNINQEIVIIPYSSLYPNQNEQRRLNDYFCDVDTSLYQRRIYKSISYFNQFIAEFPTHLQMREQNINNLVLLRKREVEGLKQIKQKFYKYKNEVISKITQHYVKNVVTRNYHQIKEQTMNGLLQFSDRINVNTNLDYVHLLLDHEMNYWLESNLKQTIKPMINNEFEGWLQENFHYFTAVEMEINQLRIEMEDIVNASKEINITLPKERFIEEIKQQFQETVSSIHYMQIDILKKITPLKNILNGVGRLLGGKNHTASLKIEQYRNYLETKSYIEATNQYLFPITKPLGTFESKIRIEINHMFIEFDEYLENELQSSTEKMIKNALLLKNLYTEKETYLETMKIFQLKIRQLEIDYKGGVNEQLIVTE